MTEFDLKNNGLLLMHIQEQTKKLCILAVKQNGLALQYVKEQTEEICNIAIMSNEYAVKYINNINLFYKVLMHKLKQIVLINVECMFCYNTNELIRLSCFPTHILCITCYYNYYIIQNKVPECKLCNKYISLLNSMLITS